MSTQSPVSQPELSESDFASDSQRFTVSQSVQNYVDRLRGGDMGSLPAILGFVVLFVFFSAYAGDDFIGKQNIANLFIQAAPICILAMGLVPVLLLGDIDLAAGVTGGTGATVMALLSYKHGQGPALSILTGVAAGVLIGFIIGLLVSKVGIPSFVVTLAFFLGLQGVVLRIVGDGGTFGLAENGKSEFIANLTNDSMPIAMGWIVAVGVVAIYAAMELRKYRRAVARDLQRSPFPLVIARIVVLAVVLLGITALLSANRSYTVVAVKGIPWAIPIVGVLLVFWTAVFAKTAYGRHVYAAGGNKEAARRAGINVDMIRVSVFVIAGGMAAVSGIVSASFSGSVTPSSGSGNTLLYAVGAAVIGGTSLFGGRGKIRDAVIGGFVVALIANGLPLITEKSYVNYIVTGLVLLLAASVDAISRRRRSVAGV
ncbi:sugar ABC transporter permease [Aeromicrobium chenweiae]|uniref:Xylose transport system permease protein XylH n=1 Tax=Aeromicrobium chenweiae TaxID=2079793 RepID=A0A2S0WLD5_9ACTN|nr:ABC transporter permease [Aeromicrobium chenweiae]AWB92092.1 ABC transporter permease [Aeromicrobium chenweiae]TGN32940.1 ABC transporter permease [Aeromicrobium chenweiae]